MNTRRIPVITLLLTLTTLHTALCAETTPSWYARKTTWHETMAAAAARIQSDAADMPFAEVLKWDHWWSMSRATRSDSLEKAHKTEKGAIDLKEKSGKKGMWSRQTFPDGVVNPLPLGDAQSCYLYREVTAKEGVSLPVFIGSNDGIVLWLNGKELLRHAVKRHAAPNQETVTLPLQKGKNTILVKVHNRTGGAEFYFSTQKQPGLNDPRKRFEQLCELACNAFPDRETRKRAEWELADNIWSWNRPPEPRHLASQYARAMPKSKQDEAKALAKKAQSAGDLEPLRALYYRCKASAEVAARIGGVNPAALRLAITYLTKTYGKRYPNGQEYLKTARNIEADFENIVKAAANGDEAAVADAATILNMQEKALLRDNPLLDFEKLLVVRRHNKQRCLPNNYHGNCALSRSGYDDQIDALDLKTGTFQTVYKPDRDVFVGDVDLHFDAGKMLFSSIDENKRWQIYEAKTDGTGCRQVTPGTETDVDNYDACYLQDEKIIFGSTRCFAGVPCVGGKAQVANFFVMDRDGSNIRQICFDQEHNMFPTLLHDGRVLYTRWEYTDTPHYFTRLLMTTNPDGTQQMAHYGSNSYWPTSVFYARPVPGHTSKLFAIVTGHHGTPRSGELVIFDPTLGRHEADGVVQRIPGRGKKVEPIIRDRLVDGVWPQFLHPYPLDENFCLVSAKRAKNDRWGLYLVDTFDNMVRIADAPDCDMYEPVPLRKTKRPPIIPNKVNPQREDAVVYLIDIYKGPGLKDIRRGSVKSLRVFQWHYAYNQMGGHNAVSVEGGWEPKRILGTVPVEADGSALFRVPANAPLAVQPLDAEGRALQIMRSWFTTQRGEVLSCVGCHEPMNETPGPVQTMASQREPSEITPWQGPTRGFSFLRDVQPVLDRHCVGCHSGANEKLPDFKNTEKVRGFTASYHALHPYVRRPGPESDYHVFRPLEYHASASELIQMLAKGHKNVALAREDWERLFTWIDLNTPDYGTWGEQRGESPFMERRAEMMRLYACINTDPESKPTARQSIAFKPPKAAPRPPDPLTLAGWPLTQAAAGKLQEKLGKTSLEVDLGDGVTLTLIRIPSGSFIMGDTGGFPDEWPQAEVSIDKPFWIGKCEISNRQYARFDPDHDSRYIDQQWKDHTTPGYPANLPDQPVIRVTWLRAMAFCNWLSEKTGKRFTLPTEAQWEYACRAGSDSPLWYGDLHTDFAGNENLGDQTLIRMAVKGVNPKPQSNPDITLSFLPREDRFNDGEMIATATGHYAPNPWGLHDMHGNVAEWTRSDYVPYPYRDDDGRNDLARDTPKVMRGGSWRDRPKWSRSSVRRDYMPWQPVYNGGFRIIME